jgi:hypothetical protein
MKGLENDALSYASARGYNTAPLLRMIDVRRSISQADLQQFKNQAATNSR